MIKNVVFDIGGVLVDFCPDKHLLSTGMSPERVKAVMKATVLSPWWVEVDRGFIPLETVIKGMKEANPEIAKDIDFLFAQDYGKFVIPRDYSGPWLKSMKERGMNVYLLTNYPDMIFDVHYERCFPFTESVDGMVVSAKEYKVKPDPDIYRILLEKYDLKPEECVFIDDRAENIEAAKILNFNAIRFTNIDEVKEKLDKLLS